MSKNHEEPDPYSSSYGRTLNDQAFIRKYLNQIEILFDDPGLSNLRKLSPRHPVIYEYDILKSFVDEGLTPLFPNEVALLIHMGNAVINNIVPNSLETKAEILEYIGDQEVWKHIRSRIINKDTFNDVLAQLIGKKLLSINGLKVDLVEKEGLPDLSASTDVESFPSEVKSIRAGSSSTRIKSIIGKANKQIKRVSGDSSGVLIMLINRPVQNGVLDDRIPSDVYYYLNEVQKHLFSNDYKSICTALISWIDYKIEGSAPGDITYTCRRRVVAIEHSKPRKRLKHKFNDFTEEAVFTFEWKREGMLSEDIIGVSDGEIYVHPMYRETSEVLTNIRFPHVLNVIREADASFELSVAGRAISLFTKAIRTTDSPVILVVCSLEANGRIVVRSAFKIYNYGVLFEKLSKRPEAALDYILENFGVEIQIGSKVGRIIPYARIPYFEGMDFTDIIKPDFERGRSYEVDLDVIHNGVYVNAHWAYAIDYQSYVRYLEEREK